MSDKKRTKNTAGGKREGAGRKNKFGEKTIVFPVRIPASKKEVFKGKVAKILKVWEVK